MTSTSDPSKISLFWVLQISGWFLYGVIYYLIYYSYKDLDLANTFGFAVTYVVAFVMTIIMRKIYQKLDYQHRSLLNVSAIVILTSITFAVIWIYVDRLVSYPIYGIEKFQQALDKITMRKNIGQIYWNSFILFTWSTLYFLINFWRQWNEQLARTEKAELLAHSAQLQMLRYQLNPHFLFNSLNSIRALILEDQAKARDMVTELKKNHSENGVVVELGPGNGAITRHILSSVQDPESVLPIEISSDSVEKLNRKFPVLNAVHDSAANLEKYITNGQKVQAIISGLPLRVMPRDCVHQIGEAIHNVMGPDSIYVQYTYDLRPKKDAYFKRGNFKKISSRIVWRNLPPARVDVFVAN